MSQERITVLIGKGPNNVEVPCMLFSDLHDGTEYLASCGLKYTSTHLDQGRNQEIVFDLEEDCVLDMDLLRNKIKETMIQKCGSRFNTESFDQDGEREVKEMIPELFYTDYYGGCGEVWQFVLKEVPIRTPFVGFDLD